MTDTARARRNARHATVVWGLMGEVALAGLIMVWLTSSTVGDDALFGRTASITAIVVAMVVLAAAIVGTFAANRTVRLVLTAATAIAAGAVGVTAFAQPVLFLLAALGWVAMVVVILALVRGPR